MELNTLRDEFAKLHTDTESTIAKVATEKRDFTADEKNANEKAFARMAEIKATMDNAKKLAEFAFDAKIDVELPSEPEGKAEKLAIEVGQTYEAKKIDPKQFSKAMNTWLKTGEMARQYATITTATASGALLPKEVAQPLVPVAPNVFRQALDVYGLQAMNTPTHILAPRTVMYEDAFIAYEPAPLTVDRSFAFVSVDLA